MKKIFGEFKTFVTKGNVFDLAIGIIIGAAFGKIIASFVKDIFTPLISLLLGSINLSDLKIVLVKSVGETSEIAITYGQFIQTSIDFLLIAIVIFIMIKMINRFKKKEEEKPSSPPLPSNEEKLLAEIRDLLKNNSNSSL